ncbi:MULTISPECIES: cell envelope integrity protein TolA [Psychrobacter]|uniref:Cell envelope integrity protein TolA n=1 Tax=Psychrobacter communis TaxID=2762238 RepID=A0ABR8RKQ1_9GAMM|nr:MULTISPECIES: cell envelope integrity protein TolA [Psychrobacter]MBD7948316.1 cell envelope integrity protein TolA [Psychrobacter communis]
MEDTMSSYSFSHQFYQRWTCAPDPVRASIIQELTDITTLLQHDTPFETFVFSTHDLDAHLDTLYENHEAEQAIAKAIAEKQAKERAAAEKERLEEEQRLEKERLEKEKQAKAAVDAKQKEEETLRAAEAAKQEQQHNEQPAHKQATSVDDNASSKNITSKNDTDAVDKLEATKTDATKTATDTDKKSIQEPANIANVTNGANDHHMKTVIDKAVSDAAIPLSLKDTKLGASHPELIRELEMHVDDYLSEQMMQISENLKSWLRAELAQHLTEPDTATTIKSNENIAKKNIH